MRLGSGALSAALLALVLAPACSAPDARRAWAPAARASSAAKGAEDLPYETPARWAVHPSFSYAATSVRLADGSCLVVEYTGQRWLTRPHHEGPSVDAVGEMVSDGEDVEPPPPEAEAFGSEPGTSCSGDGRAAVEKAPEAITGIVLWPGAYGLVGESGTLHVARSPLGPFTRRISPPEPLLRARSTGGAVLALTATGRVLRWTEETGYKRVETDGLHAMDLEVAPSGRAVVLTAPEALFTTEDAGAHLARAAAPTIGAQRVYRESGGPFLVDGVETALAWDPHEPASFAKTPVRTQTRSSTVSIDTGRTAHAGLVYEQRAALDGDHYWEISAEPGEFAIYKGKMDGQIRRAGALTDTGETQSVLMAARDRHVAVALFRWDEQRAIELRVSHDGGASFSPGIDLVGSDGSAAGLAISAEGSVLVTGCCVQTGDVDGQSCEGGPLVLRPETPLAPPRAPALGGPPSAPAFSQDGRRAYFLAQSAEDEGVALFVSRDGGASFEERPLRINHGKERSTFELESETVTTVSERGTVGMVLGGRGDLSGPTYVTTDADGRRVQAAQAPISGAALGGFGERVIAVTQRRGSAASSDTSPVSESLDGGLHWKEVSVPQSLRDGYYRHGDVACSAAGCLIGDDVTRIGWGGTAREPLPFEPVEPDSPSRELRTPIVCEPAPGSTWTRIENASDSGSLPDESDAARGRAAWMLTTSDPATGAFAVVTAEVPAAGGDARITTKQILGPIPKKELWAVSYQAQIEGVVIARMKLPPEIAANPWGNFTRKAIRNLEVAWENQEEGSSTRVIVPDAGTLGRYDAIRPRSGRYSHLTVGTLSVSPKGVFIRGSRQDKTACFADTAGKLHPFRFPDDPPLTYGTSVDLDDAVNVDGTYIANGKPSGVMPNGPEILLLLHPPPAGIQSEDPWITWAQTLAPASDPRHQRATHFNWTYQNGYLTVYSTHVVPASGYAVSWLQRPQADGTLTPPTRTPTPYDLGKTPRPCTAAEHKDLPRLRFTSVRSGVLEFVGTQHPVIVRELGPPPAATPAAEAEPGAETAESPAASTTVSLITSGVVMRGTPASPCVDAFAARGFGSQWNNAAVILGDLAHAWFFRLAGDRPVGKGTKKPPPQESTDVHDIEVRPLACHYDTTVPLPSLFHDLFGSPAPAAGAKTRR